MTNSCYHDIPGTSWWNTAKFDQIYHWVKLQSWLGFGDIDLIFKVTGGFRYMEFSLRMRYLMRHCLDCHQTCKYILSGLFQEFTIFLWPWPYFQGQKPTYKCKISPKNEIFNQLIDIHQTCMDISFWQACDIFSLWWHWPYFQGHFSLYVECLLAQLMDSLIACIVISLWQAEELIRFWWPWPHFSRS